MQNLVYGVLPREQLLALSGLEMLQGMIDRKYPVPPISRALGFLLTEAAPGRAVFRGTPTAELLNPIGTVHGGWIGTLLDSAMGCAVHTLLKPGQAYTTLEMKINFVRAVMPGQGELICEGRVIHSGARIGTSEGALKTADGKLLAHGTETCLIM